MVASLIVVCSAIPAVAGDVMLGKDANGAKHHGIQPWEADDLRRDFLSHRLCYDYGCYFRGYIAGKVYHTYYPGIYRYNYQHLYHHKLSYRYGLFSKYRVYGRHPRPYGYDFTTNRFSSRQRGYVPNSGSDLRRHSESPVRTRADRIRARMHFGHR
jgi:hypothetical protein